MKYWLLICIATPSSGFGVFFENAIREIPSIERQIGSAITRISSGKGCSGFLIKNSQGLNLVMTALHCLDYAESAIAECENGTLSSHIVVRDGNNLKFKTGRCSKVISFSTVDDLIIFQLEFPPAQNGDYSQIGYSLSSSIPKSCTPLNTLGLPGDPERNSMITETTNCWVPGEKSLYARHLEYNSLAEHYGYSEFNYQLVSREERQKIGLEYDLMAIAAKGIKKPVFYRQLSAMQGRYNCSTSGGNSGGPVYIEGTRIAVGIPSEYQPVNMPNIGKPDRHIQYIHSSDSYALFDTTASLIYKQRQTLEDHGIEIVDGLPEVQHPDCRP